MYRELNMQLTSDEEARRSTIHTFAKEVLRLASLELDALPDPEEVIASDSVFCWYWLRLPRRAKHN